ncbi:MAG: T9SS type A sorting domain-containing protein [Flavobacterium sp.]|nr:T9SS type A sorting domain-containing protein [Flavobacterium sp.]
MKKILLTLLCLFSFSLFAQFTTVQVLLKPGYFFYETSGVTNTTEYSNDVGLNQIINPYVSLFEFSYSFDQDNPNYGSTLGIIRVVNSVNAEALVNQLNAYSVVVYNASIEQIPFSYNHYLYTRISDLTNGNYVSTDSNGIIVTSNAQLNTIFQQFNVKYYELAFPGVTGFANVFTIGCQFCNTTSLKTALEGLEGTVLVNDSTSEIGYIVLLNTDSNELDKKFTLFPNPTSGIFEIKIDPQFQDLDLEIFDNNGRVVYKSKMNILQDSSQTIDISSLSNGIYFLRIKNDQFSQTEKIVKQ